MSEIIVGGYNDPSAKGNLLKKYRSGKPCIIPGCDEPGGTAWSPHWCFKHNVERIDGINKSLDDIADLFKRLLPMPTLSDLLHPLLELAEKLNDAINETSIMNEDAEVVWRGFHDALSPELVKAMIRAVVAGEECLETYAFCQLSPFQPVIDMTTAHSELASLLRK